MWLIVAGVTVAIFGLHLIAAAHEAPAKRLALKEAQMLAARQGTEEPKDPNVYAHGCFSCFWCIWFIIGNVWVFYFTPATTFQAAGGGNGTDAHSTGELYCFCSLYR